MATSSAILQSFLRDALKEQRNIADLSFEKLLEYSRTQCGLINIDSEEINLADEDNVDFANLKSVLHDNNDAVIFQNDNLYYVDIQKESIQLLQEPIEPEITAEEEYDEYFKSPKYIQYLRHQTYYNRLKQASSEANTYKRAKGRELDYIGSLTGRAFAEHRSDDFLPSLEFYLGKLDKADVVLCRYMSDKQKEQLIYDLRITLLLLAAQQQHEKDYQKTENDKKYNQQIAKCSLLLKELDPEYQRRVQESPELAEISDAQPIKYMGIPVARLLAKDIVDLSGGTTKTIRGYMDSLNDKRLYWVWGSSFIKTLIGLVAEDSRFFGDQADKAIKMPDPYTGNLSWILYYARFFMNLFLLLKHTIRYDEEQMSDEEAKTPWQERFQTEWSKRKFTLLNDSIWGTANLVCFFWLTGGGTLGAAGDAVTLALLIFDIAISIWDLAEQKTKYDKAMLQYEEDLARLERQLHALRNKNGQLEEEELKTIRQIEMQIHTLKQEQKKCKREWQLQKVSLIWGIVYATALMGAFLVLTMPFLPISAPVLASMAIAGAVLCFAFTVINNIVKGGIELYKTHKTKQESQQDADFKIKCLVQLIRSDRLKGDNSLDSNEKKFLYLEIKQCLAETEYQKQMMIYQSVNLIRSTLIQLLIPAVVFASLAVVPLGIGIPMLIAAAALAIATQFLVDARFKPEEKKELEFDEQEYKTFCGEIMKPKKPERPRLFSAGAEKERREELDDLANLPGDTILAND
ncbi:MULTISPECIES: hypothetical protein [Legionella]|uniref:hypothetical protein n=1 Tax=Legionella TaxID=445 RepID=UPI00095CED36|nr:MULTISPECIES: hypothetical protein [Legionella]MBN9227166.1 hypothetical protein [Legionella steelei]OJW07273.1 MAG: hypothetical protein BGO44_16750 [Legionella sp. 39-23]